MPCVPAQGRLGETHSALQGTPPEATRLRIPQSQIGTMCGTSSDRPAHLTESVHTVVSQKSISSRIYQLILYIHDDKGYVDEFVRELTFAIQLFTLSAR